MKVFYVIVTLAAVIAVVDGFKSIPGYHLTTPMHMAIATDVPAEAFKTIQDAATAWNVALGIEALILVDAATPLVGGEWKNIVSLYDGDSGGTMIHAAYSWPGWWIVLEAKVTLSRKLWGNALYNTALHEFGHVLGLEHSPDSKIMGGSLTVDADGYPLQEDRITLSADDVRGVLAGKTATPFVQLLATAATPSFAPSAASTAPPPVTQTPYRPPVSPPVTPQYAPPPVTQYAQTPYQPPVTPQYAPTPYRPPVTQYAQTPYQPPATPQYAQPNYAAQQQWQRLQQQWQRLQQQLQHNPANRIRTTSEGRRPPW